MHESSGSCLPSSRCARRSPPNDKRGGDYRPAALADNCTCDSSDEELSGSMTLPMTRMS